MNLLLKITLVTKKNLICLHSYTNKFCVAFLCFLDFFIGYYGVGQGFPKWAMTDIQGATSSKGARGAREGGA